MLNSGNTAAPTNATQTKERLYAQLAMSLGRTARAISQTADLCEQLQVDLHAMRIFAGLDAARFMTVAAELNPDDGDEDVEEQTANARSKEPEVSSKEVQKRTGEETKRQKDAKNTS